MINGRRRRYRSVQSDQEHSVIPDLEGVRPGSRLSVTIDHQRIGYLRQRCRDRDHLHSCSRDVEHHPVRSGRCIRIQNALTQ